jgi:hypothetical protein
MKDALATYLHDHLAGSNFAIELLDSLHDRYREEDLGAFAAAIRTEIKEDQAILQKIIERVGTAHLDLAETTGWMAEKASQLKLKVDGSGKGLGTFEALETLALGIQGKIALWQVLPIVREQDARVPGLDFGQLRARAQTHYERVEEKRLEIARTAFRP